MQRYTYTLTPLTGIHISTGRELSPLDYAIILGKERKPLYCRFIQERIIGGMDKEMQQQFFRAVDTDDFFAIHKLFAKSITPQSVHYLMDVSPRVVKNYEEKRREGNNQLLVAEMYRSQADSKPVIPGSSLKGAIRTALLDCRANPEDNRSQNTILDKQQINRFEEQFFDYDDAKNDPLRAIRIRDCVISGKHYQIVAGMSNYKPDRQPSFAKMLNTVEIIRGFLMEGDACGSAELQIDTGLQDLPDAYQTWQPIKFKITIQDIIQACNSFYKTVFKNELNKFYTATAPDSLPDVGEKLAKEINAIESRYNCCLIRLGQFSQVECTTINRYRKPCNKKGFGRTRSLAILGDYYFPLGWAKLQIDAVE